MQLSYCRVKQGVFLSYLWTDDEQLFYLFHVEHKNIFQPAIKSLQISCTFSLIPLENPRHKEPADISVLCITAPEHCNYSPISEWIH